MCIPNDSPVIKNNCILSLWTKILHIPCNPGLIVGGFSCVHFFDCTFTKFSKFWGGFLFVYILFVCVLFVFWLLGYFSILKGNFLYPRKQKNLIAIFSPTAADD